MKVVIRSEQIADYSPIAQVNYEAFLGWHPENQFVAEPLIVDLLRHNALFDPEMSLVAAVEGQIIGHVIFSPFNFKIMGREQRGVVLGPIAVLPAYQKQGIGKLLIEEGHRRAAEKGFAFALLCGHPDYYPKFGYRTGMFSVSGSKVNLEAVSFESARFAERPVCGEDLAWILSTWSKVHEQDSLALLPGENISAWSNHGFLCRCTVILRDNQPIGYVRFVKTNPLRIKELLATENNMADIFTYLAGKNYGRPEGEFLVALAAEFVSSGVGRNDSFRVIDERNAYPAFMIKVLDATNHEIVHYCDQVAQNATQPGIVVFPPMFDVEDGGAEQSEAGQDV